MPRQFPTYGFTRRCLAPQTERIIPKSDENLWVVGCVPFVPLSGNTHVARAKPHLTRRRGGDGALVGVCKSADAANDVRKNAAEHHQRNGRTIRVERAKVTVMTGLARKQNGKPTRWFVKTNAILLQNQRDAFCKPTRWFPVPMRISARSPAHPRPF